MVRTPARALLPLLALLLSSLASTALAGDAWTQLGPTGVGMVTAIAAGRTAVYAATCDGVFRLDAGASSWHQSGLERLCVVRLAVDPNGTTDTVYAIVDTHFFVSQLPEPSLIANATLFLGSALWISRDGGQTWTQSLPESSHQVAVDLTHPGTAYLANYGQQFYPLAVTHDAGETWTRVPDTPDTLYSIAVDPRDGTFYGVASGFLSSYSGGSWSNEVIPVTVVAAGSGSDGAVYAANSENFCRKTHTTPWTCTAIPRLFPVNIVEIPRPTPQTPRILMLGDGILSSDDGGATFSPIAANVAGFVPTAAFDPSGTVLYAGNDSGVYRSADRGETWTNSSAGLSSLWIRALALDPREPSTIWAGGEARLWGPAGPGVFRSTDGGESWTSASVAGEPGNVFSLAIDPSSPQHVVTGAWGTVEFTRDGGGTWEGSPLSNGGFIHGLAVDPTSSSRLWVGTNLALKTSNDGGVTWSQALARDIYCLLFDPRHPETIYAGSSWDESAFYYPYGTGFAVETSHDRGATWTRVGSETDGGVITLAVDPFVDRVVYAGTYEGAILRSSDAGATWTRWDTAGTGEPVFALVADTARVRVLYSGGWGGAFRSQDGGLTWDPFSEDLSPYEVFALVISPDGRWLYAGTTGGGVFRRDLRFVPRDPVIRAHDFRPPRKVVRRE